MAAFFWSSTSTKERIQRCNQKLADAEIKAHLAFAKYSTNARRQIAEIEIANLMQEYDITHASGSGVQVENIGNGVKFKY